MTDETEMELKPCPFCGGAVVLDAGQAIDHTKTDVPMVWTAYVQCATRRCCQQGAVGEPQETRQQVVGLAVDRWNARARESAICDLIAGCRLWAATDPFQQGFDELRLHMLDKVAAVEAGLGGEASK